MAVFRAVDLESLGNLLEGVGSPHQYMVQDLQLDGEPVTEVHHYTDLDALAGIVTADDVWLSNSTYSNDYDELVHGFAVADAVLVREAKLAAGQDRKFLNAVRRELAAEQSKGVFVACFCMKADLLSQWRTYGADGRGVSIGFDPWGFRYIAGPDGAPAGLPTEIGLLYLWRVFYARDRQERIIRDCLDFVAGQDASFRERVERAVDALRFFAPTFKNERFAEELEARLVFSPNPECPVPMRYRVARGMLVPYYSLQDLARQVLGSPWKLPLSSVQIGPGPSRELNARAAASLLRQYGYPDNVTASEAPYRA